MPPGPTWKFAPEPTSEKNVRHAERVLGLVFPADYRECAKEHGGGAPEPSSFAFSDETGRRVEGRASLLLSLDPGEDENVVETVQRLEAEGRLPSGLIPILDDGEGNYFCLDHRGGVPRIAYLGIGGEVVPVAETFSEFLVMLV